MLRANFEHHWRPRQLVIFWCHFRLLVPFSAPKAPRWRPFWCHFQPKWLQISPVFSYRRPPGTILAPFGAPFGSRNAPWTDFLAFLDVIFEMSGLFHKLFCDFSVFSAPFRYPFFLLSSTYFSVLFLSPFLLLHSSMRTSHVPF